MTINTRGRGRRRQQNKSETKHDKFKRIAQHRVNRTLSDLRLIGNLSSPNYEWGDDEVKKIEETLTKGLSRALIGFKRAVPKEEAFQFDSASKSS